MSENGIYKTKSAMVHTTTQDAARETDLDRNTNSTEGKNSGKHLDPAHGAGLAHLAAEAQASANGKHSEVSQLSLVLEDEVRKSADVSI